MATNMYKKYTESLTREIEVGANVASGAAILDGSRPGVTLAASGGSTGSKTLADGSVLSGIDIGGVGYRTNCAVVAYDGTWLFPVTGVANGDTVPDSASGTDQGTPVYAVVASGKITSLTLTVGTNTYFGKIDDGTIVGGVAPVQIGVAL